jgi:uncharacterized lipoprotein YddW (UPF0748 family)
MKRLWLLYVLGLFWCFNNLNAQQLLSPKREFRGVWVATVNNIDYPRQPTTNPIAHKEQWKYLLEKFKETGFNAVIMQVRPAADGFYPSELVPWSEYLTGKQGIAPEPLYDPLEYMINEAHKMGFEFHAWFNPYRATTDLDTVTLAPNHAFRTHRDWMVRYNNRFYFNPALPKVREHIIGVVAEVVAKYDIDAVHFDDYFYPYKVPNEFFPDSLDFVKYGRGIGNIEDWRRSNVDSLVVGIHDMIKLIKPHVQFGISPFGVWRNKDRDATGSDTRAGATAYDDLYADVVKWMRLGWIDYCIPQLYWNIGFTPADHATLAGWWGSRSYQRNLYIGHAAYKVQNDREPAWSSPSEIPKQIQLSRRNATTRGSAFFSAKSILENRLGIRDSLVAYYRRPTLLPLPPDVFMKRYNPPVLLKPRLQKKERRVRLRWRPNPEDRVNPPTYYVMYRFYGSKTGDFEDPESILHVSTLFQKNRRFQHMDFDIEENTNYTYLVTAVNRQHLESKTSNARTVQVKGIVPPVEEAPAEENIVTQQNNEPEK